MQIIVLGAGYAGLTCALRLARKTRGATQVTLVNARDHFVERIRLHQRAADQRPPERELSTFLRGTGVKLRIGTATDIDLAGKTLTVGGQRLTWDRLVLALGSRTEVDRVQGVREHAFTLDPARADALAEATSRVADSRGRVVVVGGGLTGIEGATELAEAHPGLRVTLLSRGPLMQGWSANAREHTLASLARVGVELREGVDVLAVAPDHVLTSAGPVGFELCLWSVGFAFPQLPRAAGLAVTERGQVLVDPWLRSVSHPEVYAIGDIASPMQPSGQPLPMGCKSAMPMGAHVANNFAKQLRGRFEAPFDFASPFYCVSLGRRDGVVEFSGPEGEHGGRVLTGRTGAWFKELICKATVWSLHLERLGVPAVTWVETGRPPTLTGGTTKHLRA